MDRILELLINYSYLILFLGVVVEGEMFPLAAGFLVSLSLMNYYGVILVGFTGAVVGDVLWFAAARRWGRDFLNKHGRWLGLTPKRLGWLERHFYHNGKKTLFVTKFIYSFGHSSIIVAGVAKMSWREFIKVEMLASLLWVLVFVGLGKFLGNSYYLFQNTIRHLAWVVLGIILIWIGIQLLLRKILK